MKKLLMLLTIMTMNFSAFGADLTQSQLDLAIKNHTLWISSNGKKGERLDLSGKDLSGLDFSGKGLRWTNLSEANLSKANLSYADLYNANLYKANLSNANLSKANLYKANLSEANLSKANLSEANLSKADLYKVNLLKAYLSNANLSYADLSYADLSNTDLSYADLYNANLSNADLRYSNIEKAYSLEGANIEGIYIEDKKLSALKTRINSDKNQDCACSKKEEKKELELKVGHKYKVRDPENTGILYVKIIYKKIKSEDEHSVFVGVVTMCSEGRKYEIISTYSKNGQYFPEEQSKYDLVEDLGPYQEGE
jgi:uncharacterized protein YjbI with pentapeptide repeats